MQTSLIDFMDGVQELCPRGVFGDYYNCIWEHRRKCPERLQEACMAKSERPKELEFTFRTGRGNEVSVRCQPRFLTSSDHFEFRGETISETGYRSHFTEGFLSPSDFLSYAKRIADELEEEFLSLPVCKVCGRRSGSAKGKERVCWSCRNKKSAQ
jgi:hypothetical protein